MTYSAGNLQQNGHYRSHHT